MNKLIITIVSKINKAFTDKCQHKKHKSADINMHYQVFINKKIQSNHYESNKNKECIPKV